MKKIAARIDNRQTETILLGNIIEYPKKYKRRFTTKSDVSKSKCGFLIKAIWNFFKRRGA